MGRPLAHIRTRRRRPRIAPHHAQRFIDTFAASVSSPIATTGCRALRGGRHRPVHPDRARQGGDRPRGLPARANVRHPDIWRPVSVVCPTLRRVGTTIVTQWDGKVFECRPDSREMGRRLGASGWISPFGGAAKLPGTSNGRRSGRCSVTIEPTARTSQPRRLLVTAPSDCTRGVRARAAGSTCRTSSLNIGGKKMSTSKGLGSLGDPMTEVVPPEQPSGRFLPAAASDTRHRVRSFGRMPFLGLFDEFDRSATPSRAAT